MQFIFGGLKQYSKQKEKKKKKREIGLVRTS